MDHSLQALRFRIDTGRSAFYDREICLISHDIAGNPASVRACHDELVAVSKTLCLAGSGLPRGDGFGFLCNSTLQSAQPVVP